MMTWKISPKNGGLPINMRRNAANAHAIVDHVRFDCSTRWISCTCDRHSVNSLESFVAFGASVQYTSPIHRQTGTDCSVRSKPVFEGSRFLYLLTFMCFCAVERVPHIYSPLIEVCMQCVAHAWKHHRTIVTIDGRFNCYFFQATKWWELLRCNGLKCVERHIEW